MTPEIKSTCIEELHRIIALIEENATADEFMVQTSVHYLKASAECLQYA